jgi:hypothetical protein
MAIPSNHVHTSGSAASRSVVAALLPIMAMVAVAYLVTGITLAGPQHTGSVMSWVGTALYTAYAIGAPAGSGLYANYGFAAVGVATMLLPLATVGLVAPLRPPVPNPAAAPPFSVILRAIWRPGVVLALSGVGFAAITTFVPLLFIERGWSQGWLALTTFSVAFMIARIAFGHLPDRMGGARVALGSMVVEALGLAVIWGTYTAFLDLSLGLASPALGLIAEARSTSAVFLVSTVIVLATVGAAFGVLPGLRTDRLIDKDTSPQPSLGRIRVTRRSMSGSSHVN